MFGLKRKGGGELSVVEKITMSPEKRIDSIHNEFDMACEEILNSAKKILEENTKKIEAVSDVDELEMLGKLGFRNINELRVVGDAMQEKRHSESNIKNVLYYKEHYPNNKYITEDYVELICKKYNLVWGEVSDYVGDIPKKNRQEILNFKIRDEDRLVKRTFYYSMGGNSVDWEKYDKNNHVEYYRSSFNSRSSYDTKPLHLTICADKELFNISNNKEIVNNRIVDKKLDPVVLAKVVDGYLVISKWGKEENIEELKMGE